MDMRLSVRIAFLAVMLLALRIDHPARAEGAYEIAKEMKEFYDNAKELLEWSEWTQETGLRMLDNKPGHPPPGSLNGEKFEKRLEGAIGKVEALTLPAFSWIDDDLVGLSGLSADDRRAKLRTAVASFQVPLRELEKARSARATLDHALEEVVAQSVALNATADMAPDIIAMFPTEQIYDQFTLSFASIHLSYLPTNEKLQRAIKEKEDEFDKEISAEIKEAKTHGKYILDALALEQSLLKDDVDRIKSHFDAVAKEQRALEVKKIGVASLRNDVQQLNAEILATRLDLQRSAERQSDLERSIINLTNDWNNTQRDYHDLACKCNRDCTIQYYIDNPNSCPFITPAHWSDSVRNVISRLNQISSSLGQARSALPVVKNEVERLNEALAARMSALNTKTAQVRQAESETSALQAQLDADRKAAEKEQYESRADVYAAQGLRDQKMIAASIAGI